MTVVHNRRGATAEDACPTLLGQWFNEPYCAAGDYRAWRQAASNLYVHGLLPRYEQLRELDGNSKDYSASSFGYSLLEQYRSSYDRTPKHGSVFDTDRNNELIAGVLALMETGSATLGMLTTKIAEQGAVPVPIRFSETVPRVTKKAAWTRWAPHVAVGVGAAALLTLVATAGRR